MPEMQQRILVRGVEKTYSSGSGTLQPLQQVDFELESGSFLAIIGKSGSGKSTLLNLIAGLEKPDSGSIQVHGKELSKLSSAELSQLRLARIGIVFQFFNFLPGMSLRQNICVPAYLLKLSTTEIKRRVDELIEQVGIQKIADHYPHQVSGGELQRAAIARALINQPDLILADEPTGNLDPGNATDVIVLLKSLVREKQIALIVVTHDQQVVEQADRVLRLENGRLCA